MKNEITVKVNYPILFLKLVKRLRKYLREYFPAFRLATLSDPFQPVEEKYKLSLELMKIALKFNIPLIINTKSTLILKSPWIDLLRDLASSNKVIVQYTIVVLDEKEAKILEPGAPTPSDRLKAMRKLVDLEIPVITRLQPLIPYINTEKSFLEEAIKTFAEIGVKQIISEFVRIRYNEIKAFEKILELQGKDISKLHNEQLWEDITGTIQKRPIRSFRKEIFKQLAETAKKYNISFATCREGFFEYWTAKTCCGVHLMKGVLWRKTIYEIIYKNKLTNNENIFYFGKEYLKNFRIKRIREKLSQHFDILDEVLSTNKEEYQ